MPLEKLRDEETRLAAKLARGLAQMSPEVASFFVPKNPDSVGPLRRLTEPSASRSSAVEGFLALLADAPWCSALVSYLFRGDPGFMEGTAAAMEQLKKWSSLLCLLQSCRTSATSSQIKSANEVGFCLDRLISSSKALETVGIPGGRRPVNILCRAPPGQLRSPPQRRRDAVPAPSRSKLPVPKNLQRQEKPRGQVRCQDGPPENRKIPPPESSYPGIPTAADVAAIRKSIESDLDAALHRNRQGGPKRPEVGSDSFLEAARDLEASAEDFARCYREDLAPWVDESLSKPRQEGRGHQSQLEQATEALSLTVKRLKAGADTNAALRQSVTVILRKLKEIDGLVQK